jgi:hypothetical protein
MLMGGIGIAITLVVVVERFNSEPSYYSIHDALLGGLPFGLAFPIGSIALFTIGFLSELPNHGSWHNGHNNHYRTTK